jgi:hypothetical protein
VTGASEVGGTGALARPTLFKTKDTAVLGSWVRVCVSDGFRSARPPLTPSSKFLGGPGHRRTPGESEIKQVALEHMTHSSMSMRKIGTHIDISYE